MRLSVAAAVVCLSIVGLATADDVRAAIRKPTNIPAESLGAALQQLAKDRNFQVVYVSEEVNSLRTEGAVGEFNTEEALKQLLKGTGMTYRYLDEKTVTILPASPAPGTGSSALAAPSNQPTSPTSEEPRKEGQDSTAQRFLLAQATPGQAAVSASVGGQGSNSQEGSKKPPQLEEIIVTARKREERMQDVPFSISAITAGDIDRRGLVSEEDYLRGIPGVNEVSDNFLGGSIVIRGIETSLRAQNGFSGTTVATYFGETPTTNSAGLSGNTNIDIKLVDIDRVEVLRGPQGTAFGDSSLGGAVRTIPVAPQLDRFEGSVGTNYSVTSGNGGDNHMIQGVVNVPLVSDRLAIRATVYQFDDSGFYRNVAGSSAAFQALVSPYGAQAFATDATHVGSSEYKGGRIAALYQATDDLKVTVSYLRQKTETDGQSLANTGTYEQTLLQVAPQHVIRGQTGGVADTDIDIANATVEYKLNWADLLATFSHLDGESTYAVPLGAISSLPASLPVSDSGNSYHHENDGEIRLTTKLDGKWNFLAGLYAEELKDDNFETVYGYGNFQLPIFGTTNPFIGAFFTGPQTLKQESAYGEASWTFLPRFTLTGGVRAYDYKRTGLSSSNGVFGDGSVTSVAGSASGTSFRGNLSYKPNDDALIYAGWSQGFRLGKPQPGLPPGVCDLDHDGIVDGTNVSIASTKNVNSDKVDNYEIGSKFTLLDRRLILSGDVFHIDWTGVPFFVTAPCAINYVANAGRATSDGIELEANFYVAQAFRVDLGGSRIRAVLKDDVPSVGAVSGDRLPGSPQVNANLGLQYEFQIGRNKAFVRADSTYVGTFYGDFQEDSGTKSGGYTKVDASGRVTISNLSVDVFIHNVTNSDDFSFRGISNLGAYYGYRLRPRTIGVQLGYAF